MKHLCTGIFLFSTFLLVNVAGQAQTPNNPAPIPNRTMISLSGCPKQNGIELKGALSASHSYDKMIIERGDVPGVFYFIGEMDIAGTTSAEFHFTYQDMNPGSGVNYYRIRLVNSNTKTNEITHTLMIKMNSDTKGLEVVNTVMQSSSPALTVKINEDDEASFQILDMSGRQLSSEKFKLNKGTNNITLPGFATAKGFFIIVIRTKSEIASQRVWVQ